MNTGRDQPPVMVRGMAIWEGSRPPNPYILVIPGHRGRLPLPKPCEFHRVCGHALPQTL